MPPETIQKELVTDQDLENEKRLADEQKQNEMEQRKNRKREWRRELAAKNKDLRE